MAYRGLVSAGLVVAIMAAACSEDPYTPPTVQHDAGGADAAPKDGGADAAPRDADDRDEGAASDAGGRLRIVAANITSGTQQSYEAPGIRIFQGLAPDVALVQELNYQGGTLRALVDTAFGASFSYYVEPRSGGIPNGIVSRFPFVSTGVWADASAPDRAFAYAQIDVPGPIDLWAVSIHLLTSNATARSTEARALVGYVTSTVPEDAYLVIGGDLNTENASEQALGDLAGVVATTPPFPADQTGNTNSSINRNKPHDWVFVRDNLRAYEVAVAIGASTFAAGLVFDSRVYTPLAEVSPVLATDSFVNGMQHMPVLRDFVLP